VFSHVSWPNLGGRGRYNMVSKLQFSTLSLDGAKKLSGSEISQGIDFKVTKFQVTERPW
jgi:hypothetical protein